MTFAFIEEHRDAWPVEVQCAALGVSRSGFYAWRARPQSARAAADAVLLGAVRRIHADSRGTYGSPRVRRALRDEGRRVGKTRLERLMRRDGLRGLATPLRRPRTTDSRHDLPVAPNLLARNFAADRPNTVWVADITYIDTGEGWLYLAAVMDLATRKIVGWAMRDTLHAELAVAAFMMAVQRQRPGRGLIHHSDRGVQYACHDYRRQIAAVGAIASMSRRGNALDNAAMESFFHTLKTELVHHRHYATRDEARRDLFGYIEGFYNPHRLHSALGYRSPVDAERQFA